MKARPASSRTTFLSMEGWKEKSKPSRVFIQGKRARRIRPSVVFRFLPDHSVCKASVRNSRRERSRLAACSRRASSWAAKLSIFSFSRSPASSIR